MTLADRMEHLATADLQRSLTPHADLAEAAIAAMMANLAPRLALPGRRGARARIQAAMNAAYQRALGGELDAGMTQADAVSTMLETLGELIGGLALQLSYQKPLRERIDITLKMAGLTTSAAVEAVSRSDDFNGDDFCAVSADIIRPGRT